MPTKPIFWVGSSREDIRGFPVDARRQTGHELYLVQQGKPPSDYKPMATVGPGVFELRIHMKLEHRVIFVARFREGIYVLHAFQKNTRKTRPLDLELARIRFKNVVRNRLSSRM